MLVFKVVHYGYCENAELECHSSYLTKFLIKSSFEIAVLMKDIFL